jgi:hypothetical protein
VFFGSKALILANLSSLTGLIAFVKVPLVGGEILFSWRNVSSTSSLLQAFRQPSSFLISPAILDRIAYFCYGATSYKESVFDFFVAWYVLVHPPGFNTVMPQKGPKETPQLIDRITTLA